MLSKKTMDAFAAMTGITADVLAKAISDEQEVELELPKGEFFTDEKKATLLDNHGKRKYDEGISKATKDAFEGKSKDDFLKEKIDAALEEAKVEPNKKVSELEKSVSNLQQKLVGKEDELTNLQQAMKQKEERIGLQSLFPQLPENIGLNNDEATSLFLLSHEIREDGVYKGGILLKDSHEAALTKEQAVKAFITSKGWDKTPAGRGGGAAGSGGASNSTPKTMAEYEKLLNQKGIHAGSAEAQALLQEAAKENPTILEG